MAELLEMPLMLAITKSIESALKAGTSASVRRACAEFLLRATCTLPVVAPASCYNVSRLESLPLEVKGRLADVLSKGKCKMDFQFESICWPHDGDVCAVILSRSNAF